AVRGGIVDVFSPEAPRPVRFELLGDIVESVREFDPRTQRSVSPVVKTTILPLAEWSSPVPGGPEGEAWESNGWYGGGKEAGARAFSELAEGSLRPVLFLDEPQSLREIAAEFLASAQAAYERHGRADSPEVGHYFWNLEEWERASTKTSRVELDQ